MFNMWITREAEFEIEPLTRKNPELKTYMDRSIFECGVRVHSYFGLFEEARRSRPTRRRIRSGLVDFTAGAVSAQPGTSVCFPHSVLRMAA